MLKYKHMDNNNLEQSNDSPQTQMQGQGQAQPQKPNNIQPIMPPTETPKKTTNKKKLWLIISLSAVIVAGIGFAVWAVGFNR